MESSSGTKNPVEYTKSDLRRKVSLTIRGMNPKILDNPNYQVGNPNVPESVKKQRLLDREQQITRRGALAAIGAAVLSIGLRLSWPAISERLNKEKDQRDKFWSKNSQPNQTGNKIVPPGTLPSNSQK